jgi:hypothetical protein
MEIEWCPAVPAQLEDCDKPTSLGCEHEWKHDPGWNHPRLSYLNSVKVGQDRRLDVS